MHLKSIEITKPIFMKFHIYFMKTFHKIVISLEKYKLKILIC